MARIVILGAGLTGLSAAYHLEKKGFFDYEIFEKDTHVGGLCRSVTEAGFTFDYTGHLLHINDDYFKEFIQHTIGFDRLLAIDRRSFIYSHNVYTAYPFQVNLYGLPAEIIAECIEQYVARKKRTGKKTFIHWAQEQFGTGIARYFFLPYQRKIFAYNLQDITASWTGRFVPSTSLRSMILGALTYRENTTIGYNANFFYPKQGGIQTWIKSIHAQLLKNVHTQYQVISVDSSKKIIRFSNGHEEPYSTLINTLPLNIFLSLLKEPSHSSLYKALSHLKCNSVINFNLGINRDDMSTKHWIYFPEKQFPFYRLGFPHNFSRALVPAGCSSLYGEFSYLHATQKKIDEMLKISLESTKKLLGIAHQEIMVEKIIPISHAYVIYNFWREKYLPSLLTQLQQFDIISTGRYGAWKYASMQESVLDGKKAAEEIIENAKQKKNAIELIPFSAPQKEYSMSK